MRHEVHDAAFHSSSVSHPEPRQTAPSVSAIDFWAPQDVYTGVCRLRRVNQVAEQNASAWTQTLVAAISKTAWPCLPPPSASSESPRARAARPRVTIDPFPATYEQRIDVARRADSDLLTRSITAASAASLLPKSGRPMAGLAHPCNVPAEPETEGRIVSEADEESTAAPEHRPGGGEHRGDTTKGRKRVGFTGETTEQRPSQTISSTTLSDATISIEAAPITHAPAPQRRIRVAYSENDANAPRPGPGLSAGTPYSDLLHEPTEQPPHALQEPRGPSESRPRPAIRRVELTTAIPAENLDDESPDDDARRAGIRAYEKAKRLEQTERSAPNSRPPSPLREPRELPSLRTATREGETVKSHQAIQDASHHPLGARATSDAEACRLVLGHIEHHQPMLDCPSPGFRSGAATPIEIRRSVEDYQPPPRQYRAGILGSLLKLYRAPLYSSHSRSSSISESLSGEADTPDSLRSVLSSPTPSPPEVSGSSTPTHRGFFGLDRTGAVADLTRRLKDISGQRTDRQAKERPKLEGRQSRSSGAFSRLRRPRSRPDVAIIRAHIAETIERQKYLRKLCESLMTFGAPSHRLEHYMSMSARIVKVEAYFLYLPGVMVISFEDSGTHTSNVKLVRSRDQPNLGKLRDVHDVYKEVLHNDLGIDEALARLSEISDRKDRIPGRYRFILYGLAAVTVGPFAFQARFIDLPVAFVLGCALGLLKHHIDRPEFVHRNVFEFVAAAMVSFFARLVGSIYHSTSTGSEPIFCFSALASSSIAMILPGYTMLAASLELQSRHLVAGSARMVYAIIYSLFLGYGILLGTVLFGRMDAHATSATECVQEMPHTWRILFVPGFSVCLMLINNAHIDQMPTMLFISCVGYVVSYFTLLVFPTSYQVAGTLSALAIGVMANMNSRLRLDGRIHRRLGQYWEADPWFRRHWRMARRRILKLPKDVPTTGDSEQGITPSTSTEASNAQPRLRSSLAAAAMLPAIFVQVPSGIAWSGSLVTNVMMADVINGDSLGPGNSTTSGNSTGVVALAKLNVDPFGVAYSVIQVVIGITVGLFLSTVLVYPYGKAKAKSRGSILTL